MSSNIRYQCSLSLEDLEIAMKELNEPENNDERLQKIDQLRNSFINEDHGLELLSSDDSFILRFLRARKFDQTRSLEMLINYHKQRKNWRDVFDKVENPFMVQRVFEGGCFIVLDGRAIDKSAVCIGRPGKIEKPIMVDFIAAVVLSLEQLLQDEKIQIYGVTIIQDMLNVGFELFQQIGPSLAKKYLFLLQDAMPIRLKSVNIVNETTLFDIAFAIVRPFMKEKLKKRFQAHGNKFNSLHQIIDPVNLPLLYGGTEVDLDGEVAKNWKNKIFPSFVQNENI